MAPDTDALIADEDTPVVLTAERPTDRCTFVLADGRFCNRKVSHAKPHSWSQGRETAMLAEARS